MSAEVVFYLLAAFAVVSALLCITQRNVLASALWLVSTMFSLAAIYVLLQAQFLAAIQVLVYAGAVMVLFVFVIMLLNVGRSANDIRGLPVRVIALLVGVGLLVQLFLLSGVTPTRSAITRTGRPRMSFALRPTLSSMITKTKSTITAPA
jgi:NADH-quinone oxidoreductase subunit J